VKTFAVTIRAGKSKRTRTEFVTADRWALATSGALTFVKATEPTESFAASYWLRVREFLKPGPK
jgi:hypothetical protein